MTLIWIYFVFLSVMVYGNFSIAALNEPSATVICTETGFKPLVRQNYTANKTVGFEVKVGDGRDGCKTQKDVTDFNDGSEEIGVEDLNVDNSGDEIPYKRANESSCGGRFGNNVGNTTIDYIVTVEVIVTEELREVITRQLKYEFNIKCYVMKEASTLSSKENWTISSELERTGNATNTSSTFSLDTVLQFYKTMDYTSTHDKEFEVGTGDRLYMRVEETNNNPYFKFVVNKCWSTPNSNPQFNITDVFFNNKCPVDATVTFVDPIADAYMFDFSIQAFFFSINKELAIYVHCDLYICTTDESNAKCTQPNASDCTAKNARRKRRSIGDEQIRQRTISSEQHIVFDNSEVYVPACKERYVYDRTNKECTNQQILEIKGVYLDIEWNPLYANTSSEAFIEFATVKGYQLYALLQITGRKRHILGVRVVRATQGSVILDVDVKYAKASDEEDAFTEFEDALRTASTTSSRVSNILNIKQVETIEYVPIITKRETKMENVTLIVLVIVLLAVVFILGITFYKVKQLRGRSPAINKNNGIYNVAMDKMS